MRCERCGARMIFVTTNVGKLKVVSNEVDTDYSGEIKDVISFECGSCSSQDIEDVEIFLKKIKRENSVATGNNDGKGKLSS